MGLLLSILLILLSAFPQDARKEDSLYRARMQELFLAGDREGFLDANRELIDYHEQHGNEKQLYNAYATLLDRLQLWGRNEQAMTVLQEMSQKAQEQGSALGQAVTEFCFGQFYLGNRQPKEAEGHYRRAFQQLQALGENGRALRAGLNLQAVAMNLNTAEDGLSMNDSTYTLLYKIEEKVGKQDYGSRLKLARYRFVLLQRLNRLQEVEAMQDTMLRYASLLQDSSQEELIQTAIIQFEQLTGKKTSAYERLDSLIARNRRLGNWVKVAQFRLALADYQRDNGDLTLAVDSYRAYAAENDSAQIHRTSEQLNTLAQQYQLKELQLENQAARQRITALTVILLLLVALTLAVFLYARSLKRKNRALYQASLEVIHAEEEAEDALLHGNSAVKSPEEKLYASLLTLMQKEELFMDPELGRDQLSARLGTNRTYLADAVKTCAGQTLNEFINHHRLRWAAEALVGRPDLSVMAVAEDAGFNSRATFNRLFQAQYGMSPSTYRSMSRS